MSERMCAWSMGLAAFLLLAGPSEGRCGILINEVMGDPNRDWNGDASYDFRDDEWVEVLGTGPGAEDLDGFYLGDETGAFVFGFSGTIEPGVPLVVFGSDAVAWESAHGESATGLRLGNSGDTVTLWQVSGPDTVLVDAYTYLDHEAEDDRSSGRWPDGGSEWALFDGWNPYGGGSVPAGTGIFPSPGAANGSTDPTPVRDGSWGRIKSLYLAP